MTKEPALKLDIASPFITINPFDLRSREAINDVELCIQWKVEDSNSLTHHQAQ